MLPSFDHIIELFYQNLPKLGWSVFIAIVTAWFAVQIALRKFSTQKWWERREQTYAEIVGILSSLLVSLGNWEEDVLRIRELSDQERKNISEKLNDGKERIELLAREGTFRITNKSSESLHSLLKSLNQYGDHPIEAIEIQWKAISECLDIITIEAEKDLGLEKKWYKPWTYTV